MNKTLPDNASLEHLKAQAKDLLRLLRSSHPETRLHEAQYQLAREYGFDSWPNLNAHVESLRLSRLDRDALVKLVEQGVRQVRYANQAKRVLAQHPELAASNLICALMALDLGSVKKLWTEDAVNRRLGDLACPPVVYAAFSPLAKEMPDEYLAVMTWLMDQGADPNTAFRFPDFPDYPLSILFAAAGQVYSPPVTQLLLSRGATPDDNESLYHSTETRDHSCLKLLLEAGATIEGTNAFFRMLDFEAPEGLELFLAKNLPAELINKALPHAIRRRRSVAILERLIAAGADPNATDALGISGARLAFERGLVLRGMELAAPSDEDRLLAACWRGDVEGARALRSAYSHLSPHRKMAFCDACSEGIASSVDAFLAGGFSLTDQGGSGETPLHMASFNGHLETVRKLVEAGAPLNDKRNMYQSNPLTWVAYSSEFNEFGDAVGVARFLIEAGSPTPDRLLGSPEVRDILSDKWPDLKE